MGVTLALEGLSIVKPCQMYRLLICLSTGYLKWENCFFYAVFYTNKKDRTIILPIKGTHVIATSDFKKGAKILFRDEPYMIIDFQHVKPGKGGAFVRTKLKNMITSLIREETFRSGEKFSDPQLEYKDMQYLYSDGDLYHFMDQESFEQISLNKSQIEEVQDFLKEQIIYTVLYFQEKPIAVTPPMFMELEVKETQPGVRGDTAQGGATKPATLETGLVIQIPLFVEEGDFVKVDTRDSKYIERVKK